MTVSDLIEDKSFEILNAGEHTDCEITTPYCCDLLSIAMGNAPAGCAWCTVMGNMNTLAVASLTEAGCVILCGSTAAPDAMITKAGTEGITLLRTPEPVFDTALAIYRKIHETDQL